MNIKCLSFSYYHKDKHLSGLAENHFLCIFVMFFNFFPCHHCGSFLFVWALGRLMFPLACVFPVWRPLGWLQDLIAPRGKVQSQALQGGWEDWGGDTSQPGEDESVRLNTPVYFRRCRLSWITRRDRRSPLYSATLSAMARNAAVYSLIKAT